MIAHRIQRKSGKDKFGRLGCYILDVRSPQDPAAFDRLAGYIVDREGEGERVIGAQVTNCPGAFDLEDAIADIERVQARNTRSKTDKSYHLVVSFQEGERPTLEQLRDIEATLCAAIGLGDHQRISAIHDDTDNLHIHIAINKVHPETFRNIEPHYDKRKLMDACVELEQKHGLRRDNHGIEAEVQRDAGDQPRIPDPAEKMEQHSGRESLATWIQQNARTALVDAAQTAPDWASLHQSFADHGLRLMPRGAGFVISTSDGSARVKASSVDPALGFKAITGRLGAYQAPARDKAAPGQEAGQGASPGKSYQKGQRHGGPQAADLYQRYQRQRLTMESARKHAFADLEQKHASYSRDLNLHFRLRRREIMSNKTRPTDARRKAVGDLLAEKANDRAARRALGQQQRAYIRQNYPLPTWQAFLEKEATRGDEAAVRVLRSRATARSGEGQDILTAKDREAARHVVYQQLGPAAFKNGDLVYDLADGGKVTDRAGEVRADRATATAAFLALSLASDRFVGQPLQIEGSDSFKAAIVQVAALRGFDVTFEDAELEKARQAAVLLARADEAPDKSAAQSYVRQRNELRSRVADVPEHRVWTPADAGPSEYAGRRAFKDGTEAVLLRTEAGVQVLPVTSAQAAKASKWAVGDLVVTDDRGRFRDTGRTMAGAGPEAAATMGAVMATQAAKNTRPTGPERG